MTVEFRFNGASQVILIPENARDKQMLQLWIDGRPTLRVKPNAGDQVIIEASAIPPENTTANAKGAILDAPGIGP